MGTLSKRVRIKYEVDGTAAKRGLDAMAKGTEKVREEVDGNPNNTTSSSASQKGSGTVIQINGLSVLGTVDDQSSLTIAKSIRRAEKTLGE